MRWLILPLVFSACERAPEYTWRSRCDAAQQERVFLACVQSAHHMGGVATPGNDSDEVVEACRAAAAGIACTTEYTCYHNCKPEPVAAAAPVELVFDSCLFADLVSTCFREGAPPFDSCRETAAARSRRPLQEVRSECRGGRVPEVKP